MKLPRGNRVGRFAIAAIALVATECMLAQQQRSLQPGITQTQQSLRQISDLLEENQLEIVKLHNKVQLDLCCDSIAAFKTGFDAGTAFRNGDYLQAVGHTAEAIAEVWGSLQVLPGSKAVEYGSKGIDAFADLLEFSALVNQQQSLLQSQLTLQEQLFRLQGNDPESLAQWQRILNNLRGDPNSEHQAFLKALAAHGLSQEQVAARALEKALAAGPVIVSQVKSGITLLSGAATPPTPTANEDPCARFEKAMAASDNCAKRLVQCFQPCGNPALSTAAAGACIRACGNCDRAMEETNQAVREWQACKAANR